MARKRLGNAHGHVDALRLLATAPRLHGAIFHARAREIRRQSRARRGRRLRVANLRTENADPTLLAYNLVVSRTWVAAGDRFETIASDADRNLRVLL